MDTAQLLQKYNVPVPRYTSYPPANYFEAFDNARYTEAVRLSNTNGNRNLSFYLHIPFCRHLCHYCGCNSYPMGQPDVIEAYVNALHREIDLILPLLDPDRRIAQIHYGGGSPTAIPIRYIRELNEHLLGSFSTIDEPEIAIECHPGYFTLEQWEELAASGFNRFSLGIQDFNTDVLKSVNRRPPFVEPERIVELLRRQGARINMDFLYGLPHQSPESFSDTIRRAISIRPDRLVTFSYAHVPWVNPRQKLLEKAGLPTSEVKEQLFAEASRLLHEAGYVRVGMDHFVLPDDELNTALQTHRLHRNFQGYCTRRTTAQVYAFGVTGISQLDAAYAQNTKDIKEYIDTLSAGELCVKKGYTLNDREQLTREVIETLMCNYRIEWGELSVHYNVEKLNELAADGIIRFNDEFLEVTPEGAPFVRNVAAALDPLMEHTTKSFSKPV
jgi:oxygen-independent coproporphyrinogen-3 oxidase